MPRRLSHRRSHSRISRDSGHTYKLYRDERLVGTHRTLEAAKREFRVLHSRAKGGTLFEIIGPDGGSDLVERKAYSAYRDSSRDASTRRRKFGHAERGTKAWEVWSHADGPSDDRGFVRAFGDKGEAQREIARLRRSHPYARYFLKHRRSPARGHFEKKTTRRGRRSEKAFRHSLTSRDAKRSSKEKRQVRMQSRLAQVEASLLRAMQRADKRGYTGYVGGKGGLFDEPEVKRLNKRRDALLKELRR